MTPSTKLALAGTAFAVAFGSARAVWGTTIEQQELAAASPQAAAFVERANEAARAGHAREAWELFGKAWPLAPRSPLPARGVCRLSLALGIETDAQWKAARAACQQALLLGGTREDVRNRAAAELDVKGALRPTMDDFVSISAAVAGAVRLGPTDAWGYAGRADLALWLRDPELLDAAIADLRRVAPDHPETARVLALEVPASRWVWFGRLAIVFLFVVTATHSVWRGRRMT